MILKKNTVVYPYMNVGQHGTHNAADKHTKQTWNITDNPYELYDSPCSSSLLGVEALEHSCVDDIRTYVGHKYVFVHFTSIHFKTQCLRQG